MDNDKRVSRIINIITGLIIFVVVLVALFVYRENISNFLSKKSPAENVNELVNAGSVSSVSEDESIFESSDSVQDFPTEFHPSENSSDQTNSEIPVIQTPRSELMQSMFDNAIQIPGTQNKIEPPPNGRSIELQYTAVPLSDIIPDPVEYFKNSLFLGDSVTDGFDLYRSRIKFNDELVLKDVTVAAVKSYSVYNALQPVSDTSVHPLMGGSQALPEDIIAQKDVKNVFICLGMNDLTFEKISDFIIYYSRLINRIKEKSPDKNIVIMSIIPIVAGKEQLELNNDRIIEANNALLEFAKENNIYFIDYAAAIRDSNNCLPADLSSDNFCHLKTPVYDMLVEYLLYHPIK